MEEPPRWSAGIPAGPGGRLVRVAKAVFSANAEIQERADADRRAPLDSRIRGKDAAGEQYDLGGNRRPRNLVQA